MLPQASGGCEKPRKANQWSLRGWAKGSRSGPGSNGALACVPAGRPTRPGSRRGSARGGGPARR
eukprot:8401116-Alexandrium_andersonii.AAC.1